MAFESRVLGRTGLCVGRIGLAASYGVPAAAVERAFEHDINYFYWGSVRRQAFAQAIRNLKSQRERFVLVVQSYSRLGGVVGWSVERALRKVGLEYADILLLGMWNRPVSRRIVDAAVAVRERGLVRHLALSSHHRPLIPKLANGSEFDVLHFRYNAAHPGAERDIFPHMPDTNRPGMVAFTATSWKQLLTAGKIPASERVPTASDCYRFVLTRPEIDVCMSAPANTEQLTGALDALRLGPLNDDELEWMRRVGRAAA